MPSVRGQLLLRILKAVHPIIPGVLVHQRQHPHIKVCNGLELVSLWQAVLVLTVPHG